jgi:hypothetical protein
VQRFSGAWSDGSTQRSGGRGANRFSSIGGSLSVIVGESLECAPAGDVKQLEEGAGGNGDESRPERVDGREKLRLRVRLAGGASSHVTAQHQSFWPSTPAGRIVTAPLPANMPLSAIKAVAKSQVSLDYYCLISIPWGLTVHPEWRRVLHPALQVHQLPLLQLVGLLARHELVHKSRAAHFRAQQPAD